MNDKFPSIAKKDLAEYVKKNVTIKFQKSYLGVVVTQPDGQPVGTFTYTPPANLQHPDQFTDAFTYQIFIGGKPQGEPATVTIGQKRDGYSYFINIGGDPGDVRPNSQGGLLLGGGDTDGDPAMDSGFKWFFQHANGNATLTDNPTDAVKTGGDIVVLDADLRVYAPTATHLLDAAKRLHTPVNSVETIIFDANHYKAARAATNDPTVKKILEGPRAFTSPVVTSTATTRSGGRMLRGTRRTYKKRSMPRSTVTRR
jgi:hypothetical protein